MWRCRHVAVPTAVTTTSPHSSTSARSLCCRVDPARPSATPRTNIHIISGALMDLFANHEHCSGRSHRGYVRSAWKAFSQQTRYRLEHSRGASSASQSGYCCEEVRPKVSRTSRDGNVDLSLELDTKRLGSFVRS